MPYLRTKVGTEPSHEPRLTGLQRVLRAWLFFIPVANPDYESKLHLVREWLIEFNESGEPCREIGLDALGVPVLSGPDQRNCGFWLDTNMRLADFSGEEISGDMFEDVWRSCASQRSERPSSRPTMAGS